MPFELSEDAFRRIGYAIALTMFFAIWIGIFGFFWYGLALFLGCIIMLYVALSYEEPRVIKKKEKSS